MTRVSRIKPNIEKLVVSSKIERHSWGKEKIKYVLKFYAVYTDYIRIVE